MVGQAIQTTACHLRNSFALANEPGMDAGIPPGMEDRAMRALALFFAFAFAAFAQLSSWKSWRFQLPDGAYVSFISGENMVAAPTWSLVLQHARFDG